MPLNESEAYLESLARKSFLSMWSYPSPGVGLPSLPGGGKELCDLLVLFDEYVILFSDKRCEFPRTGNSILDWKRWYRRAVEASVKQLIGAKRRLLRSPEQIHKDLSLKLPFPLTLPPSGSARVFLVAVSHGSKAPCEKEYNRPSLVLDTRLEADESRLAIGCNFRGHFVHVLDDATLETIFGQLDTINDFVAYLTQKEAAFASSEFLVSGEENLLAAYLKNRDGQGRHHIPTTGAQTVIAGGEWDAYRKSKSYEHSRAENRISYNVDMLIEHFTNAYHSGEMTVGQAADLAYHEQGLRLLASESRFGRRIISSSLVSALREPETKTFWATTVHSILHEQVRYVFLTYPQPPPGISLEACEQYAASYLTSHMIIARHLFEDSGIIIGVCIPNSTCTLKSHFLRILDGRDWTASDHNEAEELQRSTGIFVDMQEEKQLHKE